MLAGGGWTFVSYRPDRMDLSVLAALHHCFIARLREPESIQELRRILEIPSSEELANTAVGNIWLCGRRLIRLRPAGRRVPHMRHLYKYLDIPLPRHKRFYFHTKEGFLGKPRPTASLQTVPRPWTMRSWLAILTSWPTGRS